MRLHKLLFLIFLVVYFIAGLVLLITGSVAHRQASKYAEITGSSIISGAGFVIAIGVFIIVLSILGLVGAIQNRLQLLQIFIGSLCIIILLQLIAAIVGFTLRGKADSKLRQRLTESMPKYFQNDHNVVEEWNRLQQKWSCCGINGPADWNITTSRAPPSSCCLNNVCTPLPTTGVLPYFDQGCYQYANALFYRYSAALGGVSLFFFFVEIIGLILAVVVLRDLKNNYGSV
ncbi:unnamed protein product [Adineta ricciae]|uniref:Tetraspanin n=1 Tax=Adineta ricciae TaxID=249248 RepID=A0A814CTA8_ADIRI|nr:unnamed protein product [Adineta ricciae]CAF1025500.1 unnamed protein product [Adineta ricciae]